MDKGSIILMRDIKKHYEDKINVQIAPSSKNIQTNGVSAYLCDTQKDIYDFCNLIDGHISVHMVNTGHRNTKNRI